MGFDAHTATYCIPLYSSEDFLLCKTTDWYLLSLPLGRVCVGNKESEQVGYGPWLIFTKLLQKNWNGTLAKFKK